MPPAADTPNEATIQTILVPIVEVDHRHGILIPTTASQDHVHASTSNLETPVALHGQLPGVRRYRILTLLLAQLGDHHIEVRQMPAPVPVGRLLHLSHQNLNILARPKSVALVDPARRLNTAMNPGSLWADRLLLGPIVLK